MYFAQPKVLISAIASLCTLQCQKVKKGFSSSLFLVTDFYLILSICLQMLKIKLYIPLNLIINDFQAPRIHTYIDSEQNHS